MLQQIAQHPPHLTTPVRVLIDLTSLEKCGEFLQLSTPTNDPEAPDPWVRMLNGKRGLHKASVVSGDWTVASTLELSGMARQRLSNSRATGVQVVGNSARPVESGSGGDGAGGYGIWCH